MNIQSRKAGDAVIVEISGRLEFANHRDFRKKVEEFIAAGDNKLVINLDALDFIDSTGIGMLLLIKEKAKLKGGNVVLLKPKSYVREILELSELTAVFNVTDSEGDALKGF